MQHPRRLSRNPGIRKPWSLLGYNKVLAIKQQPLPLNIIDNIET